MKLLQRIAFDLKAGWATLRQGTAEAATRALEEAELVKLRVQMRKLDEQLNHLYEDLGERAVALWDKGDAVGRIGHDSEMVSLISQVQQLQAERAQLEQEMSEIRSGG